MPRAKLARSFVLLEAEMECAPPPCSVSDESEACRTLFCECVVSDTAIEPLRPWTPFRASNVPPRPEVKPVPRPPPAAMAAALKTAAALRPSRTWWRRSTVASRRPLIW
jgi:hypothetical protein